MLAPTSPGDVLDRLTILDLKVARIADPARRDQAAAHREGLCQAWSSHGLPPFATLPEHATLACINGQLWEVEDALRAHEHAGTFGEDFVALARSVYRLNDARAAAKARLDARLGAPFGDVKSYDGHGPTG